MTKATVERLRERMSVGSDAERQLRAMLKLLGPLREALEQLIPAVASDDALRESLDAERCDKCGSASAVLDSRPYATGRWRRRACIECGWRWSTIERRVAERQKRTSPATMPSQDRGTRPDAQGETPSPRRT